MVHDRACEAMGNAGIGRVSGNVNGDEAGGFEAAFGIWDDGGMDATWDGLGGLLMLSAERESFSIFISKKG